MQTSLPYSRFHLNVQESPRLVEEGKTIFFGQLSTLATNDADSKTFSHITQAGYLKKDKTSKIFLSSPEIADELDSHTLWKVFNFFQSLPLENMAGLLDDMAYENTNISDDDAAYGFSLWNCHDLSFVTDGTYWIFWRKNDLKHGFCFYADDEDEDEEQETQLSDLICVMGPDLNSHHSKISAQICVQNLIDALHTFEECNEKLTFQI